MAEKILNTKIRLLIKTYAEWEAIKSTFKPLRGEVCLCEIPAGSTEAATAPTVLFKVGDGLKTFGDLKWASALAADVYSWAKCSTVELDGQVLKFHNGDKEHPVHKVDLGVFLTEDEAKALFYTKGEIDGKFGQLKSAAYAETTAFATSAQGTKADEAAAAIATHGDIVTHDASEFAPADIDTGVHSVSLTGGTDNGTVKLTVDGTPTDNIKVTGLESAAYVTVDSLNATAKGYADAVEAKIPTEVGVMSVTNGDDTIIIGGTDKAVTVKVDSTKFDASGAAAAALEEAKKYADGKPHVNTAHTHTDGAGTKVSAAGGVDGEVKVDLNVAFELKDKIITLYDKSDNTKTALATLDATQFITDGMLSSVTADQTNNKLVFEWNTDAGVTKTEIELSSIADIYTGSTGSEVNVAVSNENVISASLSSDIITKIAKGVTAEGWGDHSKAGYAIDAQLGDLAKKDKVAEGDIDGTIGVAKITNFATEVAAVKVAEAAHADTATYAQDASLAANATNAGYAQSAGSAADADKLGGQLPSYYATAQSVADAKNELLGDDDQNINDVTIRGARALAMNEASNAYQAANAYTDEEIGKVNDRIDEIVTAGPVTQIKTTAGQGLKVTGKDQIDIDDTVVFVFNCNYDSNTFYIDGKSFEIPEEGTWQFMLGTEGFENPVGPVITYNTSAIYNSANVAQHTTDSIIPGEMYHT